jgi:CHAT domain-containing protein
VSYAPSATIYALCTATPARRGGRALICGVEDSTIPEISREVEQVRTTFADALVLTGDQATRSAVVRHAEGCGVLHIASHARFRSDNPMLSCLRLADGELTFYDVYSLRLSADLVVLSGCNTGAVAVGSGDELLGLMRGFLYAGAPSLLISMWAADDSATASLMRDFYSGLNSGASKRDALRTAQLASLDRERHPYFWAPFTLIGRAS